MSPRIILASSSQSRADMLRNAGVTFATMRPNVDEETIRAALEAENTKPRDIADHLAEQKARRIATKHPGEFVIGCDQILAQGDAIFAKPEDPAQALEQLTTLNAIEHKLFSAVVVYHDAAPVWRHVGVVSLKMRQSSPEYLADYVDRNWDSIRYSVGGYKVEEEGVRLFERIDGDFFTVLGLPLIQLLGYMRVRGLITG